MVVKSIGKRTTKKFPTMYRNYGNHINYMEILQLHALFGFVLVIYFHYILVGERILKQVMYVCTLRCKWGGNKFYCSGQTMSKNNGKMML